MNTNAYNYYYKFWVDDFNDTGNIRGGGTTVEFIEADGTETVYYSKDAGGSGDQ